MTGGMAVGSQSDCNPYQLCTTYLATTGRTPCFPPRKRHRESAAALVRCVTWAVVSSASAGIRNVKCQYPLHTHLIGPTLGVLCQKDRVGHAYTHKKTLVLHRQPRTHLTKSAKALNDEHREAKGGRCVPAKNGIDPRHACRERGLHTHGADHRVLQAHVQEQSRVLATHSDERMNKAKDGYAVQRNLPDHNRIA